MFNTRNFDGLSGGVSVGEHMGRVYRHLSTGLILSAVAAGVSASPEVRHVFYAKGIHGVTFTPLGWVALFAPLVMLIAALLMGVSRWSAAATRAFYLVFTGIFGIGLSSVLLVYGHVHVVRAALVTAIAFSGLSVYGYTTKRDLTGLGTVCFMVLTGLLGMMLVAALFGLPLNEAVVSLVSLVTFAGFTAYDTQKAKTLFMEDPADSERTAVWSALDLYLDVINIFLDLLRLTGNGNGNGDGSSGGGFLSGMFDGGSSSDSWFGD